MAPSFWKGAALVGWTVTGALLVSAVKVGTTARGRSEMLQLMLDCKQGNEVERCVSSIGHQPDVVRDLPGGLRSYDWRSVQKGPLKDQLVSLLVSDKMVVAFFLPEYDDEALPRFNEWWKSKTEGAPK